MSTSVNSKKRFLLIALCLGLLVMALGALSATAAPAAAPVDINGTIDVPGALYGALRYTGNPAPAGYSANYVKGTPKIVCTPEVTPTEFTGTLDVSAMDVGDVALLGLLDKDLMASGVKGYQSGAYIYVLRNTATNLIIGPTDGNAGGEIVQTTFSLPFAENNILNVNMTVDGTVDPTNTCGGGPNDDGCITVTANGNTRIDSYGAVGNTGVEFANGAYPGWDDLLNSQVIYDLTVNGCEATYPPAVTLTSTDAEVCTGGGSLNVDFSNIAGLYGYEFEVTYDENMVSADGDLVNGWFPLGGAFVPPGWDGACSNGTCQFAASLVKPANAVNGGGTVATVDFAMLGGAGGTFVPAIENLVLTDRDGFPIAADTSAVAPTFTACGTATVSGKVNLQGRTSPGDAFGVIKLVSPDFPTTTGSFGTDGNFSVDVPAHPDGTDYELQATHILYVGNVKFLDDLEPGVSAGHITTLRGGDANNGGLNPTFDIPPGFETDPLVFDTGVNMTDLGCIGGAFGQNTGVTCGSFPDSSTDINDDDKTNIQDLSLAGGNFDVHPFQPW